MSRSYVKEVVSNLKTGCKTFLGQKTLIIGPNGAGKSAIVNAIEAATTGRVSDVAGRVSLKLDAELATLIPSNSDKGTAAVTLSDGSTASWALEKGHRATRAGQEAAFPLRDVRENLTGSPETARKWLLSKIASGVAWETVAAMLPASVAARVATLAGSSIAGLPTALEAARKGAREAAAAADTLKASAVAAAAVAPAPMGAAEAAAAKTSATAALREQIATVERAKATAAATAAKATLVLQAAEKRLAALPAASNVAEVGTAILTVLRGQVTSGVPKCAACGGANPVEAAKVRIGLVEKVVGAAQARAPAEAAVRDARIAQGAAASEVIRWTAEVGRLNSMLAAAPAAEVAVASDAAWAAIRNLESEVTAKIIEATAWNAVASVIATVTGRLVDQARASFEAKVTAFLPEGDFFGIDLKDGDREVCRFGLRRGEITAPTLHTALSGAEWARVTAAIAAATLPDFGPAIIVPEERAFDPATLGLILRAFDSIDAQVIVTSPVAPAGVPKGWEIITIGGEQPAVSEVSSTTEVVRLGELLDKAWAEVAELKAAAKPTKASEAPSATSVESSGVDSLFTDAPVATAKPAGKKRGRKSNAEKAALAAAAAAGVPAAIPDPNPAGNGVDPESAAGDPDLSALFTT